MKSWGRIMPLDKAWGEMLRNEKGNIASEQEKENLKNKLINGISDHSATFSNTTEI